MFLHTERGQILNRGNVMPFLIFDGRASFKKRSVGLIKLLAQMLEICFLGCWLAVVDGGFVLGVRCRIVDDSEHWLRSMGG